MLSDLFCPDLGLELWWIFRAGKMIVAWFFEVVLSSGTVKCVLLIAIQHDLVESLSKEWLLEPAN